VGSLKELTLENKSISIELPIAAWNIIMNALGARPYAEVVEVIAAVKQQAEGQLKEEPEPTKVD
jgi:hypothetical protein